MRKAGLYLLLVSTLTSCFQSAIPLNSKKWGKYAVDVFYGDDRPTRPYLPLQELQMRQEIPLADRQSKNGMMLSRGNNVEQKQLLLSRLATQADRLGADALVEVKYTYFTSVTENGYVMTGVAVKYKDEF
ncbi:hypothetical protein [Spirosoma sp. KUDC1026]|uniref:hypothetical protein n=1 Tax=Spirosoma sp. KUDC1026 TaxID=2745947 RepID=UPI00159BCED9|nr:hypothetical protein [Spirosoma sp. KUDC1026]QKZ15524.1 hypothetical protein HU175_24050 [Spirosoma sp. KUDC1026]